ncbi:succinate dehydrogenase, cytochrome b556 subunit [Marinovum sp. 2_MG-2023]|uniref:succinate dehydrogenase, cytochrome b556 subunit n=1 Tax=Roseobacteraceae TaxID=2854170 RepID=UPI001FD09FCF|nr:MULTISPECIES: succinate dehydrogenase, cytochrome b556 subunit [Roseobacteraceae]MCJ7871710.1 succinate dehydrogenase, cytochrome b556 subunit [Phaeobacter sp. J2-8]MDO6728544.1 succinate dehydrogenase, cytochrome b556 subunit [Marinovum sp. 2_MG-2023]MDO6778040.1 succinate dehydrogenase, cytochrome b556 subunit [Marinovum sp. 1_MG-2023]
MADVNRGNRPLSPFMLGKYYRFQLNSVTSILTRITGNALLLGALLVVWWLLAAASGPDYFATVDWIVTSYVGDLIMFGSVWALWFHSLAGVRHLIWDQGKCLDVAVADKLGWGIIYGSAILTILTIIIV